MPNLLRSTKLNTYFLLAIFIFAYVQSVQTRIGLHQPLSLLTFTPEAAVANFIAACIIFAVVEQVIRHYVQRFRKISISEMLKILLISSLVSMTIYNFLSLMLSIAFGTLSRNYILPVFTVNNLTALLNVCIYGSFYLVYWYYQKSLSDSEQLSAYHEALAESKISQLKAQLNPHFLFNNLNILDQLIEEDQQTASRFLNDFAELYRYSLQTSLTTLVCIKDELQFANNYFKLIAHKYETSYLFSIDPSVNLLEDKLIPPFTLQLLLENVVVHNLGTRLQPVTIHISSEADHLVISNNRVKNISKKKEGGRSLNNLQEQYALLCTNKIQIIESPANFSVWLPHLKSIKND
jgi:sensor histidine kinase YesM